VDESERFELEEIRFESRGRSLSAIWMEPPRASAVAVVAHGAGGDMRHPFLDGIARGFAAAGVASLRFNFPYAEDGRRGPDRPPVLMQAWRAALSAGEEHATGTPVVATGKSLGGRMASMIAAEDGESFAAGALVFFGYPLHAPGRFDQLRASHLPAVRVPMLFIQGDADALARFDLVEGVVHGLGPKADLVRITGGDHSFRVRGAKRPDVDIGRDLGSEAARFVREVVLR
jgi:uncharacterized protein